MPLTTVVIVAVTLYLLLPAWLMLLKRPSSLPPPGKDSSPTTVSVIVPARNEGAAVGETVRRLRQQTHRQIKVLVVDDRSEDDTADRALEAAEGDERVVVIRVERLPAGWLGKNHALFVGARHASGTWLLFTDADVRFEPQAVGAALDWAERRRIDHLCLVPGAPRAGWPEEATLAYFGLLFLAGTWAGVAEKAWRCGYAGIGAFNLIRRDAYETIGGHRALRLEVADDVMLGWLVKQAGLRQAVLFGADWVRVRWQVGLWGIVRGLEKNAFAGLNYSVTRSLFVTVVQLFTFVFGPVYGLIHGDAWVLGAGLATALTVGCVGRRFGTRPWVGFAFPLAAVAMSVAIVTSCWRCLVDRAVRWRGTSYPLRELKAARRRLRRWGAVLRRRATAATRARRDPRP